MEPTVGRMVYYMKYGTPGGEFKSEVSAAIITKVHSATCVDLCVINPTGFFFNQSVVQGNDGGKWDWMPFQKELAAKTELLDPQMIGVAAEVINSILTGLSFGFGLEMVKQGKGMRLPQWSADVVVRAQFPDQHSKMTAPYLYVQSRFGKVPWKETMIELFSEEWQVVE